MSDQEADKSTWLVVELNGGLFRIRRVFVSLSQRATKGHFNPDCQKDPMLARPFILIHFYTREFVKRKHYKKERKTHSKQRVLLLLNMYVKERTH